MRDPEKSVIRGRLEEELDAAALKFTSSVHHDRHILFYDLLVDVAHVLTLHRAGYISEDDVRKIVKALKKVASMLNDEVESLEKYEDVHEAIENEVTKITESGLKMHTGRSRNDEVATCLRMFARDHLLLMMEGIASLLKTILEIAEKSHFPMPGFTHLQFAQPTRLSHHLLAYFDALSRDLERCMDAFRRVNLSPLGSAAFASSGYDLDREFSANLLGFDGVVENSEDAVASRDFLIESLFVSTSVMLSLSRIAEEIVLWSSEFDFIELPDRYSSVSSIMPQKKNPDVAELIRANAGKAIGNLTAAMTIYKAMPFSYNRDFQEMNDLLYTTMKKVLLAINVANGMLSEIRFKRDVMERKALKGFTMATEIADVLVRKYGIPFRVAHRIVAKLTSKGIFEPRGEEISRIADEFGYKIDAHDADFAIDIETVLESRKSIGGTAKKEVARMIDRRKRELGERMKTISEMKMIVEERIRNMFKMCGDLGVRWDVDYWKSVTGE